MVAGGFTFHGGVILTDLDHKTFDIGEVLAGRTYPENTVGVYLNEQVGFAIYEASQALRTAEIRDDAAAVKELDERLVALKKSAADTRYEFTVRGIPESARKAILAEVLKEAPLEMDLLGRVQSDIERDDRHDLLLLEPDDR